MVWSRGDVLQNGRYTIESVLKRGRFGITYLATDTNGNRVVIKTLDDALLNDPDFERLQQKFFKEAFKLARCQHEHIVRVLEDPFQEQEPSQRKAVWCIAMEYVAGIDLAHRQNSIMSEPEALRYIQQIGEALSVVHQQKLIHLDVKPANIMIRAGTDAAVLIDFGLARDIDRKLSAVVLETEAEPNFAPPELYSHSAALGAYTDIYALAATLYNLLTGQLPTSARERQLRGVRLTPPKELNRQISHSLNSAILKGMELEPTQRPQSVQAWLNKLKPSPALNSELSEPVNKGLKPVREELEPEKPKIKWELIWAAVGAIATLLGAVPTLIAIFNPPSPPDSPPANSKPQSAPDNGQQQK